MPDRPVPPAITVANGANIFVRVQFFGEGKKNKSELKYTVADRFVRFTFVEHAYF